MLALSGKALVRERKESIQEKDEARRRMRENPAMASVAKYLTSNRIFIGKGSCFIGEVTAIGNLAPFTTHSGGERKLREIEYRVKDVLWDNEKSMTGGLKLRKGRRVKILQTLSADGGLPAQYTQGARLIVHFGWLNTTSKGSHPNAECAFPATPEAVSAFRKACAAAQAGAND